MSTRPLLAATFAVAGLLSAQEAAPPAEFMLDIGTRVPLSLINSISTRHSAEGDRVYLETVFPLLANGRIVVPVGSYVAGTVTQLKKPGRVKGRGELYVSAVEGQADGGDQRRVPRGSAGEESCVKVAVSSDSRSEPLLQTNATHRTIAGNRQASVREQYSPLFLP